MFLVAAAFWLGSWLFLFQAEVVVFCRLSMAANWLFIVFENVGLARGENYSPLFKAHLYSSGRSVQSRLSVSFCNEFLLGSKHVGFPLWGSGKSY